MSAPSDVDRRDDLTPGRFLAWYAYNALFAAGVAYPLGIVLACAALFAMREMSSAAEVPGFLFYMYLVFSPVIVLLVFLYLPLAMALARWNPRLAGRRAFSLAALTLATLTILMLDLRNAAAPWLGTATMLLALALGVLLTPVPSR